ncbi:hypothetical protein EV693_11549 [Nicoletella semolina]|uniref:Uncharacterized protein n=1 Tax=Nicoletella semolina TaxID=271160 RepID=A0A4R2N577_9PAST|nr:hypothetical protein EV693_11549 [Nicoletella semolina]
MQSLFRSLSAIDTLLKHSQIIDLVNQFSYYAVVQEIRSLIANAREHIIEHQALPDFIQQHPLLFTYLTTSLEKKVSLIAKRYLI